MKTWKDNLEETKQRYTDWWNHKGIVLNMWEHFQTGVIPHADIPAPTPPRDLNQRWFDPNWRAEYLDWYVAHSSLKADMLPVANTQLGPGSLAAILGGRLEGGEDTIWIHPDPNYNDDFSFDPNHPNFLLHKQLLKACKQKAQGHYYVGMPDLMEGLDVLAAIKGTDKVLLDTVMQPEVLEQQLQRINDIYFQVFDELYEIIREGDEMAFCYFSSWAPGKMSKIQCDISTMLSEDDYRRFAQPFLREQCQKIDYTLYHLDGVGAMRHLPALLEIKELNAIQWTPGVGEPQGGSPKWYQLYRQILDAGKSIMACWVTLDELRPLLDNIGGDGVHLEMDFHNEAEVEQAMKIVEEYRSSSSRPATALSQQSSPIVLSSEPRTTSSHAIEHPTSASEPLYPIEEIARKRILVLDGAMGTMIQTYNLSEEDFRGERFARHTHPLKGNNDLLSLTRPKIIEEIHRRYLSAGADIIETNTFSAQRISMADYGLSESCREINLAACQIARKVADEFTQMTPDKPRFVAGSVGPTTKCCSLCSDIHHVERRPLDFDTIAAAYREQIEALIEGGVDTLLIETIFDTLNAKAAIYAAQEAMQHCKRKLPIMLSLTLADSTGHNLAGQDIDAFLASVAHAPIFSIGLNCSFGAEQMKPFLRQIAQKAPYYISAYPNAGLPDEHGNYDQTPEEMQQQVWPLIEEHLINIIGGCCGTTDRHIALYESLVHPAPQIYVSPHRPVSKAAYVTLSAGKALDWKPSETLIVGGSIDASQHSTLIEQIKKRQWGEITETATTQIENGASLILIQPDTETAPCDAQSAEEVVRALTADATIAATPLFLSSSSEEARTIFAKNLQGRSIIGPLTFKRGEDHFLAEAHRLHRLGALVVFRPETDEDPNPKTERRIDLCLRAYLLLTLEVGYQPSEIIIDPITPQFSRRHSIAPFIETVEWLRHNWPSIHLLCNLDALIEHLNVHAAIATSLQSEFCQMAKNAGCDLIITAHPEMLGLQETLRQGAEGDHHALDRLEKISKNASLANSSSSHQTQTEKTESSDEVFSAILEGKAEKAVEATRQAIEQGETPQQIINRQMIRAMGEVGSRFESGKAFVPQLLMAGRAMKAALDLLKPLMSGEASASAGKVVIGTVKGDLHDIGKNLVASMLEGCGFEVINIGIDVSAETFVEAVREHKPDILCLSALLTTTMTYMPTVIQALSDAGLRDSIKIMVGGAPVSQEFADQIGADGYSDNANAAAHLAQKLMKEQ